MAKKTDLDKILAGAEALAKGFAIAAVTTQKAADLMAELFEVFGEEEEAIAPRPQPKKQLPAARRRRKSNG